MQSEKSQDLMHARVPAVFVLRKWLAALSRHAIRVPPFAVVVVALVLFRLPWLLNPGLLNSDAAVVGVQAEHLLKGEWSWFLWGAEYQSSFDAIPVAIVFLLFGASLRSLVIAPMLGHILLTFFTFSILRRKVGPWKAALCCAPLVVSSWAINSVALCAPRQWCVTCVFLGMWLLDGAAASRRPWLRYALGAAVAMLSLYLDLFGALFIPAIGIFALCSALDGTRSWERIGGRCFALALGAGLGAVAVWLLRSTLSSQTGQLANGVENISRVWPLFRDKCLPVTLGTKVFIPDYAQIREIEWAGPRWLSALQWSGATLIVLSYLYARVSVSMRRHPWVIRRTSLYAITLAVFTVAAFLMSSKPSDVWAMRYLGPLLWGLPFALAAAAHVMRPRFFAVLLIPIAIAQGVSGWLMYGPAVHGLSIVRSPRGVANDEYALGVALRERGIHYAAADFWIAYRLALIFHDEPAVVPLERWQDRYPPWREGFESADRGALIFHPSKPHAAPGPYEAQLRTSGIPYQRESIAGFTVLIFQRRQRHVDATR